MQTVEQTFLPLKVEHFECIHVLREAAIWLSQQSCPQWLPTIRQTASPRDIMSAAKEEQDESMC